MTWVRYLLLSLSLTMDLDLGTGAVISSVSGQDFLGQFTYFRGWKDKRRLMVVRVRDSEMDKVIQEATYGYRCELATRNVNISTYEHKKISQYVHAFLILIALFYVVISHCRKPRLSYTGT